MGNESGLEFSKANATRDHHTNAPKKFLLKWDPLCQISAFYDMSTQLKKRFIRRQHNDCLFTKPKPNQRNLWRQNCPIYCGDADQLFRFQVSLYQTW